MRATRTEIYDVACEAGVSTATVSHVTNNTRYVSDKVRARLLAAVDRCDLLPERDYEGNFKLEVGKRAARDILAEPEVHAAVIAANARWRSGR